MTYSRLWHEQCSNVCRSTSDHNGSRPRRRTAATTLLFLIANTILLFTSSTDAATYEVSVSKPSFAPPKNNGQFSHLMQSKYRGNSIVTNARNLGYTGILTLGSPPQSFQVIFDTGSDMIVITSDKCQGPTCDTMDHYACTSCTKTPYSYNITYGDGTWGAGPIVADTVAIGGLQIQGQQILDVTVSALNLTSYGKHVSGLVGLMPLSPINHNVPPLQTIYQNKLLDMNVFSVYLTSSQAHGDGGSFLFGGIDKTKFSGELNQVPVSTVFGPNKGLWYIDADAAYTSDVPVPGYKKSPWLFDTGTSFIAVPTAFATAFHSTIPGARYSAESQAYIVPCKGNSTFGISFNGIKYEVPYIEYIAFSGSVATECVSLVMPLGDYEMFILGDPFLRQVYAVYDFTAGASRIGIAHVNVSDRSVGNEGLSGDPVPGGSIIGDTSDAFLGKSASIGAISVFAMMVALTIIV